MRSLDSCVSWCLQTCRVDTGSARLAKVIDCNPYIFTYFRFRQVGVLRQRLECVDCNFELFLGDYSLERFWFECVCGWLCGVSRCYFDKFLRLFGLRLALPFRCLALSHIRRLEMKNDETQLWLETVVEIVYQPGGKILVES